MMRAQKFSPMKLISIAIGLSVAASVPVPARAATFTVTNTNDSGAGSMRQAIIDANANPGFDTIDFLIPGSGPHIITPLSALPTFQDTAGALIDGYSQPGASPNTAFAGNNAVLQIVLNGSAAGTANGIYLNGGSTTVRGLVIQSFELSGINNDSFTGNVIEGNFIGTNADGTAAIGNGLSGIRINTSGITVGGTAVAARNVISGNTRYGIEVVFGNGNVIHGNFIGTDAVGSAAVGNVLGGILIDGTVGASANTIGGATLAAGNVISANGGSGLAIGGQHATGNFVQGNRIGTNQAGTAALANTVFGVEVIDAPANTIGGTAAGAGNQISGNAQGGISIFSDADNNVVQGNLVGTDRTATVAVPNVGVGVYVSFANGNTIGGNAAGASNVIAFNTEKGVGVNVGTGNAILSNSIFDNGFLGIDLNPGGVTANDLHDPDGGANNLQNFPVLLSALSNGSVTTVAGALNSTPATAFTLQFFASPSCDPSGNGEGKRLLGSTTVTTNRGGNVRFFVTVRPAQRGEFVTATATDPNNNTSEFSACRAVTAF